MAHPRRLAAAGMRRADRPMGLPRHALHEAVCARGRAVLLAGAALGLLLAGTARAAPDAAGSLQAVSVRHQVVLAPALPGKRRLREVSGLAWDAAQQQWLSVGDRGLLVRWTIEFGPSHLVATPVLAQPLDRKPDAESLDLVPSGRPGVPSGLAVLDEGLAQVQRYDAQGRWLAAVPLPVAAPRVDYSRGVEALAWHPGHGLIVAPQRPTQLNGVVHHVLAAEDGHVWTLPSGGPRASIKAAHVDAAGRLLLLEKLAGRGDAPRWLLRELDLSVCGGGGVCPAATVPLPGDTLAADDNFEGLACRDDGHCLLVSDDGRLASPRTVLLWLALQRAPAR